MYDEAQKKGLDSGYLHLNLYLLAFVQNDVALMAEQSAWANGKEGFEHMIRSAEADAAAYSGHLSMARELSDKAVALAKRDHQPDAAGSWQAEAALREALFGNSQRAREEAKLTESDSDAKEIQAAAALSEAYIRDASGAQLLADRLEKRFPEDTLVKSVYLPIVRAKVELDRHNPDPAIKLLELISPYELGSPAYIWLNPYAMFIRGEAYLAAHQAPAALQEFQKIIAHREVVQNLPIGTLAHLELGRAYALDGDNDKSRAAYKDFLRLWKDADPDIPILQQAKIEYSKLQ